MDREQTHRYETQAAIIKAMAHPTRLLIIDQLSQQDRCVGELTAMIGADTSTVSKHLSILRNEGLIDDEKRGKMVFYRLKCPCILKFFSCLETVLQDRLKDQMTLVPLKMTRMTKTRMETAR